MSHQNASSIPEALASIHKELRLAIAPPLNLGGYLWLICHLASFVDKQRCQEKSQESSRRALMSATKGFLDDAFERRSGERFLEIVSEILGVVDEPDLRTMAKGILNAGRTATVITRRSQGERVSNAAIRDALKLIERHADQDRIRTWANHTWMAFKEAIEAVSDGTVDETRIETTTNALVPTRYMIRWLATSQEKRRLIHAPSKYDVPLGRILERLGSAKFSTEELLSIHEAFSKAVVNLPSIQAKKAAKLIGVTVDRVHRMAALGELDSFIVRRRIPRTEVSRRKKGARPRRESPPRADSPETTEQVIAWLSEANPTIPSLLEFQDVLTRRINRVTFALKTAVARMGYTDVHIHSLINRGELSSFSLPRLIPESEVVRLQRDPAQSHAGRPRISER